MENKDLIQEIYKISENYKVILRNHIVINGDVNVILFAHYCSSKLFYKDFFNITRQILHVNKLSKRNLKEAKRLIKKSGYKKVWTKGTFSFYGDLRSLAVKAGFGEWGDNGIIVNDKYGSDFLISAIFYK